MDIAPARVLAIALAAIPIRSIGLDPAASRPAVEPAQAAPATGGESEIDSPSRNPRTALEPFVERIGGTVVTIEMVPVPAGRLSLADSASPDGARSVEVGSFWMSKTEVTWDAYDVFVFGLDEADPSRPAGADAVTRPSRPYIPPDRGFGHEGFPAISVAFKGAESFAAWLATKTGRRYRLPTEAEWEWACRAGAGRAATESVPNADAQASGSEPDARAPATEGEAPAGGAIPLTDVAWFAHNAGNQTRPAGKKAANARGLHDMLGNVAEWAVGLDGGPVACGGSYRDGPSGVQPESRLRQAPSWNATDPQVPKSSWWLSDGPFVGFRVLCEPERTGEATGASKEGAGERSQ